MLICVLAWSSRSGAISRASFDDAEVLNDQRVGAGFGDGGDGAGGFGEFVFEDQRVESEIAADAARVQRAHDFGQFFEREADFGARGEMLQAEVDGVGAGFDGGAELRPVTGGAHDFGLGKWGHGNCCYLYDRAVRSSGNRRSPFGA